MAHLSIRKTIYGCPLKFAHHRGKKRKTFFHFFLNLRFSNKQLLDNFIVSCLSLYHSSFACLGNMFLLPRISVAGSYDYGCQVGSAVVVVGSL